MLREKVKERDKSGYRASRNEFRFIEMSRASTPRIPGHNMDYLDFAIPRKRAKKRKGLDSVRLLGEWLAVAGWPISRG